MLRAYLRRANPWLKLGARQVVPIPLQRRLGWTKVWSIGLYVGSSPTQMGPDPDIINPILTRHVVSDVRAAFVADPFALFADGTWYLYFEVLNRSRWRGEIGLATSTDLAHWRYEGIALAESFHLSYPHVFAADGAYYLIPESYESGSIRLYRAPAPSGPWSFVGVLLDGPVFLDPTVFRHDGRWWLFTETNPRHTYDTLRLYHASELTGPWKEHPDSPVVRNDPGGARPAGRVVASEGRLIRYAQDCRHSYGAGTRAFEILELTTHSYRERPVPMTIALADGARWGRFTHHLDPHRLTGGSWVIFVDGRQGSG